MVATEYERLLAQRFMIDGAAMKALLERASDTAEKGNRAPVAADLASAAYYLHMALSYFSESELLDHA